MPVQKEVATGDWQRTAAGRAYRYIDIDGHRYTQWDNTTGPVLDAQAPDSTIPRSFRQDSRSTPTTTTSGSYTPATITYGSSPPDGHQHVYSLFPRQPTSLSAGLPYSATSVGRPFANSAGEHPGNVVHNQSERSAQVEQSRPGQDRHASEPQSRHTSGREPIGPGQTSKKDQPSYPPGTRKILKKQDRVYCYDGDDKLITVVAATRQETRADQGQSATEHLTERFAAMNTQGRRPLEQEPSRISRHSNEQGASIQATREDAETLSRHASDLRGTPRFAGSDARSIPARPDMARHYSQGSAAVAQDQRAQSRERSGVRRPQDYEDEDDDYDDNEESSTAPAQHQRRLSIPSQPRGHPQRTTSDEPPVQHTMIMNDVRRPSVTQGTNLATISESGLLKTTRIAGDNKGRSEVMDDRYYVHKDAKNFFAPGRVFAMLWHENAGNEGTDLSEGRYYNSKYGQKIYSTIRRMVVVKQKHGHCTCVPIATYGRQGTLKSGLSDADIRAHAVIYMVGTSSAAAAGEKIVKNPIAVKPANEGQKLHAMSRINFDKIYTIEHNVKVMNVGKVADESIHNLSLYFYNTHFGGN